MISLSSLGLQLSKLYFSLFSSLWFRLSASDDKKTGTSDSLFREVE